MWLFRASPPAHPLQCSPFDSLNRFQCIGRPIIVVPLRFRSLISNESFGLFSIMCLHLAGPGAFLEQKRLIVIWRISRIKFADCLACLMSLIRANYVCLAAVLAVLRDSRMCLDLQPVCWHLVSRRLGDGSLDSNLDGNPDDNLDSSFDDIFDSILDDSTANQLNGCNIADPLYSFCIRVYR